MNYPKFKLGDTIKALKDISFSDGSQHSKNEKFFVQIFHLFRSWNLCAKHSTHFGFSVNL